MWESWVRELLWLVNAGFCRDTPITIGVSRPTYCSFKKLSNIECEWNKAPDVPVPEAYDRQAKPLLIRIYPNKHTPHAT